jgi:hypothetical protein
MWIRALSVKITIGSAWILGFWIEPQANSLLHHNWDKVQEEEASWGLSEHFPFKVMSRLYSQDRMKKLGNQSSLSQFSIVLTLKTP